MNNNKAPQKQTYRYSDAFIKKWTRVLLGILFAGIGGGLLVMVYAMIVYGDVPTDELPVWLPPVALGLLAVGFVVPLLVGAILGGLAIHRYAWIPLLLVISGLLTVGASGIDGFGALAVYGFGAMILGVIGAFFIAIVFTNVPIWLQFPIIGSPRLYLRGKNKKK